MLMWKNIFIEASVLSALIFGGLYINTAWNSSRSLQTSPVVELKQSLQAENKAEIAAKISSSPNNNASAPREEYRVANATGTNDSSNVDNPPAKKESRISNPIGLTRKPLDQSVSGAAPLEEEYITVTVSGVTHKIPLHFSGNSVRTAGLYSTARSFPKQKTQ